jgi:hypothetical protein
VVSQRVLIFVSSTAELEAWTNMRIERADDATSVVRKYFLGTRTRHGKIASISTEEKAEGPDEKGVWKVKGTYFTEAGLKEDFTATVSPRGEVLITGSTKSKPRYR